MLINKYLPMQHLFKNSLKSALIISIIVGLVSCSKDDEPSSVNSVKLNNKAFSVSAASITGISIGDDGHTAITFVSGSGLKASTLTIDVESFTKETISGTYSYPQEEGDKFLDDWLTNYTVFEEDNSNSTNLRSGTVTISHNDGNNYSVEMDLEMTNDLVFSGLYTGEFSVVFMND